MASSFDQGHFVSDNYDAVSPVLSRRLSFMRSSGTLGKSIAQATGIAMVLLAAHPHALSQDLKDRARANGGRITTDLHVQGVFASLKVVAESADVIVRARIIRKDPRLTPDGQWVRTYFQFVPLATFKDTVGITPYAPLRR